MNTGISLYFSNKKEENDSVIRKAVEHGARYVFTSLHIPEEDNSDLRNRVRELADSCSKGGLQLMVDVGPETLEKLNVTQIDELQKIGISHVRLDYGFSPEETVRLSKKFQVVLNASTITKEDIQAWRRAGADFTRFAACHNFYPKEYTGLSIRKVREINQRLQYLGFTTMAFVPGSRRLRGPLYEGLPTVEQHRRQKEQVLLNMLELYAEGLCDVALIGDLDVEEKDWRAIGCLSHGYVELKADILPEYTFVRDTIHHDRPDSSDWLFRSQESRYWRRKIEARPEEQASRKRGSIAVSNEAYLRYMGELEIARMDMPGDSRLNVIGQVCQEDQIYLPYIRNGLGVKLV